MDGTQWTSRFTGLNGNDIDMSLLRDDFFGPAAPAWTERLVKELPVVKQGDTGEAVRTVQGLCDARHMNLGVDGIFGPQTEESVKWIQARAKLSADGIVGPQTWPVLLGIA